MMEEQSFEKRKVASDLNISNLSGISTFDNEAYDNESTFVSANTLLLLLYLKLTKIQMLFK